MLKRTLDLKALMGTKSSAFLLGARGVGKTQLAKAFTHTQKHLLSYDLLKFSEFNRYLKNPSLLTKEIEEAISEKRADRRVNDILFVWIDEIQKVPLLLDEIHSLIENNKGRLRFLLTGSSARKLKRVGANLLAGRALSLKLHPFTHQEIDFDRHDILRLGSLPGVIIDEESPELKLKSYVDTYLKEEIFAEALVRRVDAFSRFLEIAGQVHGEPINAHEIGKAAGVSGNTVKEYFQILEDTLIGWKLPGWNASVRKQLRTTPKFFFFDNGVANALRGELRIELREGSSRYGKLFEAWIVQELFRINDYWQLDLKFSYWQTNIGTEVDIIVSRGAGPPLIAIEIKSAEDPDPTKLHGLLAFGEEHPDAKLFCFCRSQKAYKIGSSTRSIRVMPWQRMFEILKEI